MRRSDLSYRADIQGLRAIAVSLVVLFHFGVHQLSGGFIGVDVFFVISGYLITGLIVKDLEAGKFSFGAFYLRRMRRLLPALLATVLLTFFGGVLLLSPPDLEQLGRASVATIVSLSNFVFLAESGYFDADAITKPLLHTWSLAVEEQFYFVWPALLWLGYKYTSRAMRIGLLIALALASLILSAIVFPAEPVSFFMMPFRLFEFFIGAALVWLPTRGSTLLRSALAIAGLVMIVGSAIVMDEATPFPSWIAAIPCLGTATLIYARAPAIVAPLLSNRMSVWLGTISYSLYLVHWPIVVYYVRLFPGDLNLLDTAALVAMSLVAAVASYHLVERPFRMAQPGGTSRFAIGGALAAMLVAAPAAASWSQAGWSWRLPSEIQNIVSRGIKLSEEEGTTWKPGRCYLGGFRGGDGKYPENFDTALCLNFVTDRPNVLIWGDSMAAHLVHGFETAFPEIHFLQATLASCRPFIRATTRERGCARLVQDMLGSFIPQNASRLDAIILAGNWKGKKDQLRELATVISRLSKYKVPLIVIGDQFQLRNRVPVLASNYGRVAGLEDYLLKQRLDFTKSNAELAASLRANARFVDADTLMCTPRCFIFIEGDLAQPITRDGGHLVPNASVILGRKMRAEKILLFVLNKKRDASSPPQQF